MYRVFRGLVPYVVGGVYATLGSFSDSGSGVSIGLVTMLIGRMLVTCSACAS